MLGKGKYKEAHELSQKLEKNLWGSKKAEIIYFLTLMYIDPQSPYYDPPQAELLLEKLEKNYYPSVWGISAKVWRNVLQQLEGYKIQAQRLKAERERKKNWAQCRILVAQNKFERALLVCKRLLPEAQGEHKAALLYYLGLLYANPKNPQRDLNTALSYFREIEQKWPTTIWGLESQIWCANIRALEELKKLNLELEKTKERIESR